VQEQLSRRVDDLDPEVAMFDDEKSFKVHNVASA
jgi:hypothetical protein